MNANASDMLHLDPLVWPLAGAETTARIRMIEKDLFIEHDYSRHLGALLRELIAGPRQTRMPCLLIVGDAGMGKTAQLHRFQRQHPDVTDAAPSVLLRPIVIVNVPPEPTRITLTFALLEALNAPTAVRHRTVDHAGVIRRMLAGHRTRIVIFDEIQHICYSRARDRSVVLDTIKSISTESQVNVICAGTRAAEREFMADAQLERRFEVTRFVPWAQNAAFRRFLEAYERVRPLRLPSFLGRADMMSAVLEETAGITHRIVQRLNAAAMVAVHERIERITCDLVHVQRTEPERVHAARQTAVAGVVEPTGSGQSSTFRNTRRRQTNLGCPRGAL